jgi:hypothetical protein
MRVWPRRIRISTDSRGQPKDINVYDADTGTQVMGVMRVEITLDRAESDYTIKVLATPDWPIDDGMIALYATERILPAVHGVFVIERTYHTKDIELVTSF